MRTLEQYQNRVNRVGRISESIALIWMILVPIIICAKYDIFPSLKTYINASLGLFLVLTPTALAELISFCPMLGSGATYLSFETGNVSNIKVPCIMNAMKIANVEPGTEESEVLSTISAAISSIVTTVVIILGVILLIPLAPFFTNEYVMVATDHLMPALFGALILSFAGGSGGAVQGQWKAAIVPLILVIVVNFLIFPIAGMEGFVILIMIPITLFCAKILHKKGHITVSTDKDEKSVS